MTNSTIGTFLLLYFFPHKAPQWWAKLFIHPKQFSSCAVKLGMTKIPPFYLSYLLGFYNLFQYVYIMYNKISPFNLRSRRRLTAVNTLTLVQNHTCLFPFRWTESEVFWQHGKRRGESNSNWDAHFVVSFLTLQAPRQLLTASAENAADVVGFPLNTSLDLTRKMHHQWLQNPENSEDFFFNSH